MKKLFIPLIAVLCFVMLVSISSISKTEVVTINQKQEAPLSNYHNDVADYWIKFYSTKYEVPEKLMESIFYQESRFVKTNNKYNAHVVGDGGRSFGVGQVQLRTAKAVWKDSSDIKVTAKELTKNIKFNVETATKLVAQYRDKYAWNYKTEKQLWLAVLTAYNGGEGYVTKYKKFNAYSYAVYNRYKN